jgi:transposase
MKATPEATRLAIIAAYQKHGTYKGTAAALSLSPMVVKKWIQRFQTLGTVAVAKKTGRKRALSTSASVKAHQLLLSNQYTGSDHVARELHKQGITATKVHKTTVIRAAKGVAKGKGTTIRALRGRPCKQLSPATMQKRLAFAKANKKRDWGRVLFTDRKKFLFCYPGVKVMPVTWVSKGGEREAAGPNHPMALNVYCGVSRYGVTSFHMVAGTSNYQSQYYNQKGQPAKNITKQEYRDVLMKTLLPAGQRLLGGRGLTLWVLQQDNDPTHSVASTTIAEFNKAYNSSIKLLDKWPPNSPDLNIIENLWSYVEGKVRARGCETFQEFMAAVKEELASVPQKVITSLYQSIPKRLAIVIRKKGGKTGY